MKINLVHHKLCSLVDNAFLVAMAILLSFVNSEAQIITTIAGGIVLAFDR